MVPNKKYNLKTIAQKKKKIIYYVYGSSGHTH